MNEPKIAFELKKIRLSLDQLLPVRQIKDPEKSVTRYKTILTSIKEVGLIEPLMVYPQKGKAQTYLIMDGHYRYFALRELGEKMADCILSTEDESFTFNARISRVAPIQEHRMIVKAIDNGVSPKRIAAALNMNERDVHASIRLLDGIHEEAADLLKDKVMSPKAIRLLKRVSGVRQIEIAELMVSANNFTTAYAEALLLGTPRDQLLEPEKPKVKEGLTPEIVAKMEAEMEVVGRDFRAIESSYGQNVLDLTVVKNFVEKLLENGKVVRFLSSRYSEILPELEKIAAIESL